MTKLMEKTKGLLKEIKIVPMNNPRGVVTDLYTHFMLEDELVRQERDCLTTRDERSGRPVSLRFLPQIDCSPENL